MTKTTKITNEISTVTASLPWYVARDEGFFAAEDLDVDFVKAGVGAPKNQKEDTTLVDPILGHGVFQEGKVNLFRACEEGNVRRAHDLKASGVQGCDVQITSLQPSRYLQAVVTGPNSGIDRAAQLANQPIGVNFFAGSHFAAIRLLEGFIGRDRLKLQHFGMPAERFDAMMSGQVPAIVIMEPYITLAEKLGALVLAEGHFVITDVVRDDLPAESLRKLYRALDKAADFLNASADNKRKYLHYLIDDIPADYKWGRPEASDFHLPRLRFGHTDPYPQQEFERSQEILEQYGLLSPGTNFGALVNNSAVSSIARN